MRLILTGSIAVDRILNFPGKYADIIQPDKLHVLSLSVLVDHLVDTRGGIAANIAYNLALLGEKPVLLGSVGNDAKAYMADLKKIGVNTSFVHFSQKPTASFTVMTDQADCQVGGFYPGAMGDAATLTFESFDAQKDFLVISPHDPKTMAKQVKEARQRKFRYFYDIGQQVSNVPDADVKAGIAGAELLIVNDYEMSVVEQKTGMSQSELVKKIPVVIITLGEKGSLVFDQGKKTEIEAVPVKKVIDPTGAGDAYRAGFLFGYMRNWSISECVQLGSIVATFAIQKHGTQVHSFTNSQIAKMAIKQYKFNVKLKV
ncbi:MAG: carbohydrate kinase family protein [Patescibacteria group bacterium]